MSLTAETEPREAEPLLQGAGSPDRPLAAGTVLRDYELREVAGSSPWSIVYVAWDRVLRRRVAVQEYRPQQLAGRAPDAPHLVPAPGQADIYALGLKAFVAEARLLARFDHPCLVRIYRFWEEHGTAYRAMPLCEGPTLEQVLAERRQDEAEVRAWLRPMLDAVAVLHVAQAWHHHVVPASIVMTGNGPVLLDMAAARRVVQSLTRGPAAAADAGYAAIELYSDAATLAPGPWTDLYALAAIAYRAFTGIVPPPASERAVDDRLVPLAAAAEGRCGARLASAIDAALVVAPESRTRHDADFRALAGGLEPAMRTLPPGVLLDLMSEPFVADRAREVTVPIPTQPLPTQGAVAAQAEAAVSAVVAASAGPESRFGPPAPVPFARAEPRFPPGTWMGIAGGLLLLAAAVVAALQASRDDASGAPRGSAAASPRTASAPTPSARPAATGPAATTATAATTAAGTARAAPAMPAATAGATASAAFATARPAASPRADVPRTIDVLTPPRDEADRHDRCADLLQEATLPRLSAAESAFFRQECR